MKHLLTIAGSDSGGGAGIQADLKTFSALGAYGMTVISALTAQNTRGVQAVLPIDADFVGKQIDSVFQDIRVDAVKIGMLPNPEVMRVVAERLNRYKPLWVVVDPVMVAKGGHSLMPAHAVTSFCEFILPLASVLTPNLPEAEALAGQKITSFDHMESAGRALVDRGVAAVLVKGGHREGEPTDVLVTPGGCQRFAGVRLNNRHTHGTGCSLSSAIAVGLANELDLAESVKRAKEYVTEGIRNGLPIGGGTGPIHHFWAWWPSASGN